MQEQWAVGALRVIGELRQSLQIEKIRDEILNGNFVSEYPEELREEEYPKEGTVLNPLSEQIDRLASYIMEHDLMPKGVHVGGAVDCAIKIIEAQRQEFAELIAVIAPLKDTGFEQLNKLAKKCLDVDGMEENPDGIKSATLYKVGEVIDRANEYFNGR